jgi:hypothetical protein
MGYDGELGSEPQPGAAEAGAAEAGAAEAAIHHSLVSECNHSLVSEWLPVEWARQKPRPCGGLSGYLINSWAIPSFLYDYMHTA